MCKYHIVFSPKYRRKIIYNQYRESLQEIIRSLCNYKGVEILEGHMMPDHVHLLVRIPPKISISSFMGYLKGKSALMMFDKHANLKYKFGNRHFWSEGYYVSTVGLNEQTIGKYIREQEKQDILKDKLSVKEYEDPFKNNPFEGYPKRQMHCGLNKVKASALRRWQVTRAYSLLAEPPVLRVEAIVKQIQNTTI